MNSRIRIPTEPYLSKFLNGPIPIAGKYVLRSLYELSTSPHCFMFVSIWIHVKTFGACLILPRTLRFMPISTSSCQCAKDTRMAPINTNVVRKCVFSSRARQSTEASPSGHARQQPPKKQILQRRARRIYMTSLPRKAIKEHCLRGSSLDEIRNKKAASQSQHRRKTHMSDDYR